MYQRDNDSIKPRVRHTDDIRYVNMALLKDIYDLTTKVHGYGFHVHNALGMNSASEKFNSVVDVILDFPSSQGINILKSDNEIVLISTKGGNFVLPESVKIISVSESYYDSCNKWIVENKQGIYTIVQKSVVNVDMRNAVYILTENMGLNLTILIYRAEYKGISLEVKISFAVNGYVKMPSSEGYCMTWINIDVVSYAKARKNTRFEFKNEPDKITIEPSISLDRDLFDCSLSMSISPVIAKSIASVEQNGKWINIENNNLEYYFKFNPYDGPITIIKSSTNN